MFRFAGADTTAIGLRTVFYHLLKDPYVLAELRTELDNAGSFDCKYHCSYAVQAARCLVLDFRREHDTICYLYFGLLGYGKSVRVPTSYNMLLT